MKKKTRTLGALPDSIALEQNILTVISGLPLQRGFTVQPLNVVVNLNIPQSLKVLLKALKLKVRSLASWRREDAERLGFISGQSQSRAGNIEN